MNEVGGKAGDADGEGAQIGLTLLPLMGGSENLNKACNRISSFPTWLGRIFRFYPPSKENVQGSLRGLRA